jgi:hypothetical protein
MNGISKFIGSSVFVVALLFTMGQVSAQNLIQNPGFETGDLTGWSTNTSHVPGGDEYVLVAGNGPPALGFYNADMTNSYEANSQPHDLVLSQSTAAGSAIPGSVVSYSFDLKLSVSLGGGVFNVQILDINSTGGVIDQGPGLLQPSVANDGNWHTFSGSFTAPASVNPLDNADHFEIEFHCTAGPAATEAMYVDNVSLTQAVPEPTTVTLVGLGLFGAGAFGRKRKS